MNVMTNQVDQFYIVNDNHDITVKSTQDGKVYFTYKNGKNETLRSDLIDPKKVTMFKITPAAKMEKPLHRTLVTLESGVNGGIPIPGEDYEIRIAISQFQDMSEESIYYKYGFVHATTMSTPDASSFYKEMAISLAKNFSREVTKFFKFYVTTDSTPNVSNLTALTEVTATTKSSTLAGTYTGIVIEELAQDWNLALMPVEGVNYAVTVDEITYNGENVKWGVVSTAGGYATIKNGYDIADMEYFFMGERGDQYRMFARPQDRIPTKLLADVPKQYDVIDIHYYFTDSLGGVQKSEKDITLAVEKGGSVTSSTVSAKLQAKLGITPVTVQ